MSCSNGSVNKGHKSNHHFGGGGACCATGNWSGLNIAAMVIGFVAFWPLGLFLLYWNISGRDVRDLPEAIRDKWNGFKSRSCRCEAGQTGNSVFEEFQQTQYDRIREIKEEIKNRAQRFSEFRSEAKRRADEKEFREFMSNKPDSDAS